MNASVTPIGAALPRPASATTAPPIAPISPVEEIVAEMAAGRMVILVDEEDRENEGDIVLPPTTSRPRPSTSWPATRAA